MKYNFFGDVDAVYSHPNEFSPGSPQGNHREDTLLGRVMQVAMYCIKLHNFALRYTQHFGFCWEELCKHIITMHLAEALGWI